MATLCWITSSVIWFVSKPCYGSGWDLDTMKQWHSTKSKCIHCKHVLRLMKLLEWIRWCLRWFGNWFSIVENAKYVPLALYSCLTGALLVYRESKVKIIYQIHSLYCITVSPGLQFRPALSPKRKGLLSGSRTQTYKCSQNH